MPTTFLSLPLELREQIYDLVLVIDPCINYYPRIFSRRDRGEQAALRGASFGLFYTNKIISDEALQSFYGQNAFSITKGVSRMAADDIAKEFFRVIGSRNASYVGFLHRPSPDVLSPLSNKFVSLLHRIQKHCRHLRTLDMEMDGGKGCEIVIEFQTGAAVQLVAQVKRILRDVAPLQKVVIKSGKPRHSIAYVRVLAFQVELE